MDEIYLCQSCREPFRVSHSELKPKHCPFCGSPELGEARGRTPVFRTEEEVKAFLREEWRISERLSGKKHMKEAGLSGEFEFGQWECSECQETWFLQVGFDMFLPYFSEDENCPSCGKKGDFTGWVMDEWAIRWEMTFGGGRK